MPPRLRRIELIAYERVVGTGKQEDPYRTLRCLCTTAGILVATLGPGDGEWFVEERGFDKVFYEQSDDRS